MTMSLTSSPLQTIADTARWVAFYRALESERPDAHFHDPYARLLAGERGQEIVRTLPWGQSLSWAVVVRTCLFDEILLQVVQKDEVDTVLNLAAGLDTRPYRLSLPTSLQWMEVDLPEILSDKEEQLAHEHPVCRLERVKLDLADSEGRNALFAHLNAAAKRVLVIAEGLLIYLTPEQVASLATDLHAQAAFRWWLTEYISPCVLQQAQSAWNQHLAAANARMQFAPEEGEKFFERYGWRVAEFRSTWEEASRLKRDMPFGWLLRLQSCFLPKACRETYRKLSGALLLERK